MGHKTTFNKSLKNQNLTHIKMSNFPKPIYKFNRILLKIPLATELKIPLEIDKLTLKFMQKAKSTKIANDFKLKKNKVEEFILPNIQIYYKATAIKTVVLKRIYI